jgi:HD-GYP domain-containing protein (c-di-GMP phosphodiesterase class II)
MTSDRVYRAGKPYEDAASELELFAGKQFDPQVVAAFHKVPREDWEDLRRRSVIKKQDDMPPVRSVAALLKENLARLAS